MATSSGTAYPEKLTCWKDIARYMGKGVRTVQRWEQKFGLPVYRPLGAAHKSSVIAHPHDLDGWLEMRWSNRAGRTNGKSSNETNQTNETADPPISDLSVLSSGIRTSRELRSANRALVKDLSTALHALGSELRSMGVRHEDTQSIS